MKSNEGGSVLTLVLVITIAFTGLSSCQCGNNLTLPASECICPGSSIQFTCTAVGGGSTVWTVGRDQQCRVQLRHLDFSMPDGVTRSRSCREAPYIIGRSLSVDNNRYTSQLKITVGSELNGTTVSCEHDDGTSAQCIGTYVIILTSGPFSPPNNVHLTNITAANRLTFSWSQVAPNCSTISYNIFASDSCGQCPASTNLTNITCSEAQLISDAHVCDFSVQTNVCGNITGNHSDSLSITPPAAYTRAPTVKICARYKQNTTTLTSFVTVIDKIAPASISGINIAVQFFTVNYSISGSVCDSKVIELNDQACDDGRNTCMVEYDVTSTTTNCTLNTRSHITVIVSATSDLGTGQRSRPIRIAGSTSHFVRVSHGTNRIICTFMNQQDMSIKSCNVSYAQCGQQQTQLAYSVESAFQLVVDLKLADPIKYCYNVTASNSTFFVLIEGSILGSPANHHTELIAGIITSTLCVMIIAIIVLISVKISKKVFQKQPSAAQLSDEKRGVDKQSHSRSAQPTSQNNELIILKDRVGAQVETPGRQQEQYDHDQPKSGKSGTLGKSQPDQKCQSEDPPQLEAVDTPQECQSEDPPQLEAVDTPQECLSEDPPQLEAVDTPQGCQSEDPPQLEAVDTPQECLHDACQSEKSDTDIQQNPKQYQNSRPTMTDPQQHLIDPQEDSEHQKENATIQGSPPGQGFQNTSKQTPTSPREHDDLHKLDKSCYTLKHIDKDCGLMRYMKENGIEFCRGCAFYEFHNSTEDICRNTVIILVDKITDLYYSGERARRMVCDSHICESEGSEFESEIKRPDRLLEDYIVFVQDRGPGNRFLSKGTKLLIHNEQLAEVPPGQLLQFPVEEECELLTFIESQTYQGKNLAFQRGNAFYEFSHDSEDISGKKQVILMDVEKGTLHTGERARIMLGVPGKGIRNPYADRKKWRVFIQSTSTGNRHIDKDTIVLYQVEANIKLRERKSSTTMPYLSEVDRHVYEVFPVKEDGSLKNFIENIKKKKYERGCCYYEPTDKGEDIDSSKEVMLMNEEGKLFTGPANLPNYSKVFIWCYGLGHIYIRKGTSVIYKDPEIPDLQSINREDFQCINISQTCELWKFVHDKFGDDYKKGHAYSQFTCATEDIDEDKEIILMDKKTEEFFTGTAACRMIGAPGIGIPRPPKDFQFTVFIQNRSRGSRCLIKGSILLYKNG